MEKYGLRPLLDLNAQEDPLLRVNAGTPRPVTVSGELTREHPEPVARYLAMLQQTARWALNHPEDVITAIAAERGQRPMPCAVASGRICTNGSRFRSRR